MNNQITGHGNYTQRFATNSQNKTAFSYSLCNHQYNNVKIGLIAAIYYLHYLLNFYLIFKCLSYNKDQCLNLSVVICFPRFSLKKYPRGTHLENLQGF